MNDDTLAQLNAELRELSVRFHLVPPTFAEACAFAERVAACERRLRRVLNDAGRDELEVFQQTLDDADWGDVRATDCMRWTAVEWSAKKRALLEHCVDFYPAMHPLDQFLEESVEPAVDLVELAERIASFMPILAEISLAGRLRADGD